MMRSAERSGTWGGRGAQSQAGLRVLSSVSHSMDFADANAAPTPPAAHPEPARPRRYALITPCRDESKYARRTLDAIVNQTARPAIWVIVDDGSKDQTPAIL